MIIEFLELVVAQILWQKVVRKLSIAQVYYIVGLFNEASEIKEAHEWIYNPPMFEVIAR
jgi:hypothetical protein